MGDDVAKWLSKFILEADTGLRLIAHLLPSMKVKSKSLFSFPKVCKV